ncbi:type I-E CRISPR-associated endoribonuclease Cas2e [Murinocardiopsis flavida]|nr:type I-E CRISPR-associated endoribonuclease Cas2e [Murinocardiopsis flavida]
MVVISTTAVPDHVRGAISRWLIEPAPGFYVGTVSAKVRDMLWDAVSASVGEGAAVCVHPAENEQRYVIKTAGQRRRRVTDLEGLQLVAFMGENGHVPL